MQAQILSAASDGLAPSVFDPSSGAAAQLLAFFSPTSEAGTGRDPTGLNSHRAPETWGSRKGTLQDQSPEAWCSRTGTLQAKFPTQLSNGWHYRLLTLLSNTPRTKWCCSGSPCPIFAVVSFVLCRGRRVIFLRGAVHDDRNRLGFLKTILRSGAHDVVGQPKHTQTHRPRRAQL